MKEKIKYTNEPLGELRIIEDFLPPPQELAFSQQSIKVTIALSKASVDFFKKEAKKKHPVPKDDSQVARRLRCEPQLKIVLPHFVT